MELCHVRRSYSRHRTVMWCDGDPVSGRWSVTASDVMRSIPLESDEGRTPYCRDCLRELRRIIDEELER